MTLPRDEAGYGKRIREMMRYSLSSIKRIHLVEREDINAIIREMDFSETGYVKTKEEKGSHLKYSILIHS